MIAKGLNFKVSSHLKDILGKDLITDRYVAIYELVKNSLDAGATEIYVKISPELILIKDNGSGMNITDIKNKWLFVGYSEKKEDLGTYAGSKGIGRFSSDTLGENLTIRTRKKSNIGIELDMNWRSFEENQYSLIEQVVLPYREKDNIDYGTELIITNLRSHWTEKQLIKLKDYLSKLKNPLDMSNGVKINLETEFQNISGVISNNIMEVIMNKSIFLKVEISSNKIHSTLIHNGNYVCEFSYKNDTILNNINIEIFHLSQSAKLNFTKKMGMPFTRYGNIFIYRNGYRVIPYGNENFDIFGLNIRKSQGFNRYLGTRDLLGYILIKDRDNKFKEVTSRDGGFVVNESFLALQDLYMEYHRFLEDFMKTTVFNKLEHYQIDESIVKRFLRKKDFQKILGESKKISNISDVLGKIENNIQLSEDDKKSLKENALSVKLNQEMISDIERNNKALQNQNKAIKKELILKQRLINKIEGTNLSQDILEHHLNIETNQMDIIMKNLKVSTPELIKIKNFEDFEIKFYESLNKIKSLRNLIKSVNYDTRVDNKNDMIQFISEYCEEWSRQNNIRYAVFVNDVEYIMKYKAILLTVVLDNILDNALSFKARMLRIYVEKEKEKITVNFETDTGKIDNLNPEAYFNYGYSTKKRGTGNGMFFVKKIITENFLGKVYIHETTEKFTVSIELPIREI
ncbi:MAG: ATP-binding protein [Anaerorhabdus sp.]